MSATSTPASSSPSPTPSLVTLPDGPMLSVTDVGQGPPLVLLHGVAMSSAFFERNIDDLARDHRVIAIDYRGHGRSPAVDGGHTVDQYARDVHALLTVLDVRDAVAVAWSMGAFVAWDYLLQLGELSRIARVVVVSQGPSDLTQADWPHGIADVAGVAGLHRAVQSDSTAFLSGFLPLMFADALDAATHDHLLASIATIRADTASAILVDQTLLDYRQQLPAVTTPHLLVWGDDEKVIAAASGRWLDEHLPDSSLVVIEGTGHCPMWEQPERFSATVRDWLSH